MLLLRRGRGHLGRRRTATSRSHRRTGLGQSLRVTILLLSLLLALPCPGQATSTLGPPSSRLHRALHSKRQQQQHQHGTMASSTSTLPAAAAAAASTHPPPPSSSSAAAQARLLELDRLCERLARRLREAEDRLHEVEKGADGTGVRRRPRVVFSDLDGTLLHFGGNLLAEGYEVIEDPAALPADFQPLAPPVVRQHDPDAPPPRYVVLRYKPNGTRRVCIELPSLTSGPGYISVATLRLVKAVRTAGCDFVLITGARSSTYLMRRRIGLPVADYEVIEGGGRLLRDPDGKLDSLMAKAGAGAGVGDHQHDAADAHGPAWDAHWREAIGPVAALRALGEELAAAGWAVDGRDYLTNFRVDTAKGGKTEADWEAVKARLPTLGLASSFNLGKADIYPATSGKAPAVARLMRRLHAEPRECVALFDDDNDLGMAALCAPGRRIAVSVTHESVRQLVTTDPGVETTARPGVLATEEALQRVLASLIGQEAARAAAEAATDGF